MKIKKKSITSTMLTVIFLAIVSFFIISLFIAKAKEKSDEEAGIQLCRISIATREKTGIETPVIGTEIEVAPLICSTAKAEDVGKDKTKEEVMKYIANKIVKCWYKYQEGNVKDVFKGSTFEDNCQICYPLNIKEWKDYKEGDKITSEDLVAFMYNNVYKVREDNEDCKMFGGYCVKNEEECEELSKERSADKKYFKTDDDTKCKKGEEEKVCCYSSYDCLSKGGVCSYDAPGITYKGYDKWACPSGTGECWIKEENYYTYLEYVQSYGGLGVVAVLTQNIEKGQSYAISFGSPTENCGDTCIQWAKPGLAITGIGIVITAAGVFTLNPAIGIAGAKVTVVGLAATGVGAGGAKLTAEIANFLKERDINTIYLSTLNDATYDNICEVVE